MYNVKLADLLFVHSSDFVSREIEHITHSPYSHVAGYVTPNRLIEAQGFRRVGYQQPSKYLGESNVYTCDTLTDAQRDGIARYVRNSIGERYDYLLIVWELIRYTLHIVLPYNEHHTRICSTLWVDAYRSVGVDLCPDIRYPSPGDLAQSKLLRKV